MMIIRIIIAVLLTAVLSIAALFVLPFQRSGRFFHFVARNWARMILKLFGVKAKVRGAEHLVDGQHYVFVSNHASMFDIPTVLGHIPGRVNIVLKKELTRVPIWGWALALGPYIVIDRFHAREASRSLEEAASNIRSGKSVLLFAEGTRTRDGKLQPFKRGAFSIAVKSGVPVVPVTINNTYRIMQKGSLTIHPMDIELVIGTPIATAALAGRDGELHLMHEVHRVISADYVDQSQE